MIRGPGVALRSGAFFLNRRGAEGAEGPGAPTLNETANKKQEIVGIGARPDSDASAPSAPLRFKILQISTFYQSLRLKVTESAAPAA